MDKPQKTETTTTTVEETESETDYVLLISYILAIIAFILISIPLLGID